MSRGNYDYDNPNYSIAVNQGDLSLLSVMQGGYAFLDGRGRTIWYDNFMQGLRRWNISATAGGTTPFHSNFQALSYGYYGEITFNPNVNGGTTLIQKDLVIPFGNKVGLEVILYAISNHGNVKVELFHAYADNAAYIATFRIVASTHAVVIETPSGDVTVYSDVVGAPLYDHFINMKIVGDFTTGKYVRMVIGGHEFDLSGYNLETNAFHIKGRTFITITDNGTTGGNTGQLYLGGVALTTDEP